jgi:hypothetical protein
MLSGLQSNIDVTTKRKVSSFLRISKKLVTLQIELSWLKVTHGAKFPQNVCKLFPYVQNTCKTVMLKGFYLKLQ